MTDFSRPYASSWKVYSVNRRTWADDVEVPGFTSASISRTADGCMESGSFDLHSDETPKPGYYRLVLYATQDGTTERHDIATLYCALSRREMGSNRLSMVGMSVLWQASVRSVDVGAYIPMGRGAQVVASMLADAISAPVEVDGDFTVSKHYVFEPAESVLDAVREVLDSAGWRIRIDGRGSVLISKIPDAEPHEFGTLGGGVLIGAAGLEFDALSVPNRYRATDGQTIAVAVNDDEASETSIRRRGFIRDIDGGIDTSPVLIDGESLSAYAQRKLMESRVARMPVSYDREYADGLLPNDLVSLEPYGISDMARVASQSIKCDKGIVVSETANIERLL